ncbi:group III truncated hemoglobin [Hymenobacter sp. ASUV-10]|uniref:Group III truncated hemoglobin n=1 Tax=Hymenobacter aranciens TaxID=3063996 RepID=A0ABT9BBC6_9BACT|nr:group III truncated hemoglobin [Hymenobacter sp. ASUV-10]MDO7875581.1 group III truncated hemoglobin [Hymenobacter sp. ASUV-10]
MSTPPLPDLRTEADIVQLVDTFYERVSADALLAPIFMEVAQVDWSHHLPTMYDFWSSVLLGTSRYKGRPLAQHFPLPIGAEHFQRWLALFHASVDSLFSGPGADDAKKRAQHIGAMFQQRLGLRPSSPLSIL